MDIFKSHNLSEYNFVLGSHRNVLGSHKYFEVFPQKEDIFTHLVF